MRVALSLVCLISFFEVEFALADKREDISNFIGDVKEIMCNFNSNCNVGLYSQNLEICKNQLISIQFFEEKINDYHFDRKKAEECVRLLSEFTCGEYYEFFFDPLSPINTVCLDAVRGKQKFHEFCTIDNDCDIGLYCFQDEKRCSSYDKICEYNGPCYDRKIQGSPCSKSWECYQGLLCLDGLCTEYAKKGQDCSLVSCQRGLHCLEGVCQAPAIGVEENGYCDYVTKCGNSLVCSQNLCTKRKGFLEACSDTDFCEVGLFCQNGVCNEL